MFNKKEVDEIRNLLKGLPLLNDKDKIRRVNKAKKDFWYAVKTYFPHHIDNIVKETSEFRKFVYTNIEDIKKKYIFDPKSSEISGSYLFGYEKDNPSYEFLKKNILLNSIGVNAATTFPIILGLSSQLIFLSGNFLSPY